jgi:hypothetical protein
VFLTGNDWRQEEDLSTRVQGRFKIKRQKRQIKNIRWYEAECNTAALDVNLFGRNINALR